jgi:malate dehydrogenase
MHIAQIGVGRVGRPTANAILSQGLADELTVCDVKPKLAAAFAEELRHAAATFRIDTEIVYCEQAGQVSGADLILISAGQPRQLGMSSRRVLAATNGRIVKEITEETVSNNPGAKYIVITNPVDSMAMICKKFSHREFVISTGTCLESARFRSKLAQTLNVPVSKVQGWAGGEHGTAAVILWSQAHVYEVTPEQYASKRGETFAKSDIESYMKHISYFVIEGIGGTEFGPAATFADLTNAIVNNTDQLISVGTPMRFESIPEQVHVGCPIRLGLHIGPSLYDKLPVEEQRGLEEAAKAIYATYQESLADIEEHEKNQK